MPALMTSNGRPVQASPQPGRPSSNRPLTSAERSAAGPSKLSTMLSTRRTQQDDPVRAAQDEATRVWRADMRKLLDRAEERFADICWTTAASSAHDQSDVESDLGHATFASSAGSESHSPSNGGGGASIPKPTALTSPSIPSQPASADTLIWAHKAILYARAPNTFQTRFLNLRSPAAQLQHIGSTASLVSLPLHRSESQISLTSNVSNSTQTGAGAPSSQQTAPASTTSTLSARAGIAAKARKSIRGAAPPSSFSMTRPSLRKPISRSSISRPIRRGSVDDVSSFTSGFMTSDSEGEGGPATSLRASRLINARNTPTSVGPASLTSPSKVSQVSTSIPGRKPSFASVTSTADSRLTTETAVSEASTLRAPISLGGVSQAFFEATLQYLYTGEEAMIDAFEFLFEDRLASDSEATPEEKLDKLRSDLTFMWRSKLYSDVKLVLGDQEDDSEDGVSAGRKSRHGPGKMVDIPDANMSVLSLAQTIDTERVGLSDTEEDDELTSFSTHRMILASRSEYFASLLLSPYSDSRAPILHLPSPPFTPASLHFTLGFLYTGTLFFSNRTFDLSTAFSLWRAGAYLQIETLQALVVALIDREFCHGFMCSPPCRKCVKRVPRTLAFAASPDVSEPSLQDCAISAVSGPHFGLYWAKDIGNLDPVLQDRIVDSISDRLRADPTQVVSVLRQLSIVGQRIDTERSSRWVESLRLMAETVENRLMPVLHANLELIVQSQAWSDLLDGVGYGDVLEKSLVMLIDGLTEARAAQMYQILLGQVLLREQGFEVAQSRQAVENARASVLRYLKKRWINVRALGGFNKLEKWCLKELADELEVSTADLILPEEAPSKVAVGPPSRLLGSRPPVTAAIQVGRRTSSVNAGARGVSSASAAPANPSRLRTASGASSTAGSASPVARRPLRTDEGEREAGPINMRAAVLNRNAARTSVANGHRSLSSASTASTSSPTTVRASATRTVASPTPAAARTTTSTARTSGLNGSPAARAATPNAPTTTAAAKQRLRTESASSVTSTASTASARLANGRQPTTTKDQAPATPSRLISSASSKTTDDSTKTRSPPSTATPKRPTTSPAPPLASSSSSSAPSSVHKTPTKIVRPVRSAATLSSPSLSGSRSAAPAKPTTSASVDSPTTKPSVKAPVLGHKSSFLRATPGPGGTFSLSSTDSGRDLRARTVSSASRKSAAGETRSVTPTRGSTSSNGASTSAESMPADAMSNIRKATRSDSTKTIVYHPPTAPAPGAEGISLNVGIPCIVSLPLPSAPSPARGGASERPRKAAPSRPAKTTVGGAGRKVRAVVRYLGPVVGKKGVWVGVQLNLPPSAVEKLGKSVTRLKEGRFEGVQYFHSYPSGSNGEEGEKEGRLERRKELWRAISPHAPFPESSRESKEDKGEEKGLVELFVRPGDVVWVVQ